ncbi:MAG: alpha/beta fold hydrolase [Romboutsia sp.]|nr:alpha/beta fold hydrolase [Romboutsia sp.]
MIYQQLHGSAKCDTVYFKSEDAILTGYFFSSEIDYSPTLIFLQGFMETGDIWNLGKTLSNNGINVFMFDFRGCFGSTGKQGLLNSQKDIDGAFNFLKSKEFSNLYKIDSSNIILGGYSYGGHMAMLYSIYHSKIKRIISIAGGDLGIFASLLIERPELWNSYFNFFNSIKKPIGPVEFVYDNPIDELLENQSYFSICNNATFLQRTDILLIAGLDDQTVLLEKQIIPIYRELKKNKHQKVKIIIYETDHSFKDVSNRMMEELKNWINY